MMQIAVGTGCVAGNHSEAHMKRLLYALFRIGICWRCDRHMLPWRDGEWACPDCDLM